MTDSANWAKQARGWAGLHWESFIRNGLLVVILIVMVWLAFNVRLPSEAALQTWIESLGWLGFVGFIGLYALVALTPIPVTIMSMAAGLLFGVALGSALSVVGALLGSWAAYWLARLVGEKTVLKLLGEHGAKIAGHLDGAGFYAVFSLRLMPGIPYWPVNYASGVLGITQRDFLLASAVSMIPGQVSLVAVGSFVVEPSVPLGIVVAIAWAVVIVMTVAAFRAWKRSGSGGRSSDAADSARHLGAGDSYAGDSGADASASADGQSHDG